MINIIRNIISNQSIDLANSNIVCVGNSLTLGAVGSPTPYPTQLAALNPLDSNGSSISNIGIGARSTTDMLAAPSDVQAEYDVNKNNNILIVWEGRNDLAVEETSVNTAYNNLVEYCGLRRAEGWKILILTVLPSWIYGYKGDNTVSGYNQLDTDRLALNVLLRQLSGVYELVDVALDSGIGDLGDNEQAGYTFSETRPTASANGYYYDGTHMTTSGYGVIANYVLTGLLNL